MTTVSATMDRRVKERLVGAAILVALIVLVVPELLSGPRPPAPPNASAPAPIRSVSVDLATRQLTPAPAPAPLDTTGAGSGGAASAAPMSEPNAEAPGRPTEAPGRPTETPGPPPLTITTLKAQPPPPAPGVEIAPSSPNSSSVAPPGSPGDTAPPEGRGVWAVQLGSFARKANADKLVHQLQVGGSAVYLISSGSGAALRYRVRVGPLPDREAAMRALMKLNAAGHAATLVTPSS